MSDNDPQTTSSNPARSSQRSRGGKGKSKRANAGQIPGGQRPGTTVTGGGVRHQSRVLAMQFLFERDLTGHDLEDIFARSVSDDEEDEAIPPPVAAYATEITTGVLDHLAQIDPMIAIAAPAFPVDQLASIDRNVLRIAIYELLHQPSVPDRAVINEAVEVAKHYGGPSSSKFVNGVLGTIVRTMPVRVAEQSLAASSTPRSSQERQQETGDDTEASTTPANDDVDGGEISPGGELTSVSTPETDETT